MMTESTKQRQSESHSTMLDRSPRSEAKGKSAMKEDPDWTSSSGSSSEDEVEEMRPKPVPPPTINKDLKDRLAHFLPQMAKANEKLKDAAQTDMHQIETVAENEEQYVEMDLALGVLTERSDDERIHTQQHDNHEQNQELTNANPELLDDGKRNRNKIEEIQ